MDVNAKNALPAAWWHTASQAERNAHIATAQRINEQALINTLPNEVVSQSLTNLPIKQVATFARAASSLRPGAQILLDTVRHVCTDITNANLAPDAQGKTVSTLRDAILRLPVAHQAMPLHQLEQKLNQAINALPALGGNSQALEAAYARVLRQIFAMPEQLINRQFCALLGLFSSLPQNARNEMFEAAVDRASAAPEAVRPELLSSLAVSIHKLTKEQIVPALDRLLTPIAKAPAAQRAQALKLLPEQMETLHVSVSKPMFYRVENVIDMASTPLREVWCKAGVASLSHEADDNDDLQLLDRMLQRIDQLPEQTDRGHALQSLAESMLSVLSVMVEDDQSAILGPVFEEMLRRTPMLDDENCARCLELLAKLHPNLPDAHIYPEWGRLLEQARMLPGEKMAQVLGALGRGLDWFAVKEMTQAVDRLWQASAHLDAPRRYECAIAIAESLVPDLRDDHPEGFQVAANAILQRSTTRNDEHRFDYLQHVGHLFAID